MKLAVLSDIHSNYHALKACVAKAEEAEAEGFIFLGDYISDCANPHKTMKLLYKLKKEFPCYFIKGNREEYVLNYHKNGGDWRYGASTGSLLYTYENLTKEDLEFFDSLPITDVINPNGKCDIRLCHGSPTATRECVYRNMPQIAEYLFDAAEKITLGGHIHLPYIEDMGDRYFMNPGTVGMPVGGDVSAEMALIESDGDLWHPKLMKVEYDYEAAVKDIENAGLIALGGVWTKAVRKMLRTGNNYAAWSVILANKLENGHPTEEHWLEAAKQLHIE